MRKIIAMEFVSLDGVMQSPGSPDEDASNGFTEGGWISRFSDPVLSAEIKRQMSMPFDLLLGRKTFEIWAGYWPLHADAWPGVGAAIKYVASTTMTSHEWRPSVFLNDDIAERVDAIKLQRGPDLHVYGSSGLMRTLLEHDLVDELRLKIFPITLGKGKRLFADGAAPAAYEITESRVTTTGVIIVNYRRAGT